MAGFIETDGLRAYVSEPERRSRGGVLVLPAVVGIGDHIEDVCGWINKAGLTALAWDPYSACPADQPVEERYPIGLHKLEDEPCRREQIKLVDYMQKELGLDHIGTMGFCMGGRQVFNLCAADHRIRACVAYHPSIDAEPPARHLDAVALAREVPCPVQVMYPGRDHITSNATFKALREALESRSAPTFTYVFPDSDHGFTEGYSPVSKVDRRDNPANPAAKALAWPQTAALFQSCLS
jgi:carboxymethylenebutenolidase